MNGQEITRQANLVMFDAADEFAFRGFGDGDDAVDLIVDLATGDWDAHKDNDATLISDVEDILRGYEWDALADEIAHWAAALRSDSGRDDAYDAWIRSTF